MYSLYEYGWMISSAERTNAYVEALRRSVKPNSVLVDIGTGTGIWALLACQFGARKVYAIEPDDVIQVAREAAEANGFGGRIEFIQDLSTRLTLPEQADVIVSDIRGVLPPFGTSLASIVDARRRLLAPDGVLIPGRDTLWAALVNVPGVHASFTAPWDQHNFGNDLSGIRNRVMNTWKKERISEESLVTEPRSWTVLDYYKLESYHLSNKITWTLAGNCAAHGVAAWFDSTLIEGVCFSNAPGAAQQIYGQAFFPWPEPVNLKQGDIVSVNLQARCVGADYVWSWETEIFENGRSKAHFRQSTFYGAVLSKPHLRKRALSYRPRLTEEAEIETFILTLMDGQTAVENIGAQLYERFPGRFNTLGEAQDRVADLSLRFSQ